MKDLHALLSYASQLWPASQQQAGAISWQSCLDSPTVRGFLWKPNRGYETDSKVLRSLSSCYLTQPSSIPLSGLRKNSIDFSPNTVFLPLKNVNSLTKLISGSRWGFSACPLKNPLLSV